MPFVFTIKFTIMKVVLAEKPSVAMAIAKALDVNNRKDGYLEGNGYQITWAFGHLVSLQTPEEILGRKLEISDLPYLPNTIPLKLIDNVGAKKQYKIVAKLFSSATEVICATDAGREGELIFRLIFEYSKCNALIKRLWISSYSDEIIKNAFNNLLPGESKENLYKGGKFRQIADWYIGYNSSIALSRKNGYMLKVGRVKTPTLFLVVKRYLENVKFVPTKFFIPKLKIETQDKQIPLIMAQLQSRFDNYVDFQKIVSNIYSQKKAELVDVLQEEKTTNPPKLYNLAELQKKANIKYGFTADETLNFLQKLYESGFVSYPRTDSQYLNSEMEPEVKNTVDVLEATYKLDIDFQKYISIAGNKSFNDKKVTDHHAIIPLKTPPILTQLDEKEKKIYLLILTAFLKAFSIAKIIDSVVYSFSIKNIPDLFYSKGATVKELGFTIFDIILNSSPGDENETPDEKDAAEENQKIPNMEIGKVYLIQDVVQHEGWTQPPSLLTDATLISQMENCGKDIQDEELKEALSGKGIGTSATRSAIIKELVTSEYIERKKKTLVPTKLGFEIIRTLNGQKLLSPELTGEWESQITQLENEKIDFEELKAKVVQYTKEVTEQIIVKSPKIDYHPNKTKELCPGCKVANLLQDKFKYYCENSSCDFTMYKNFRGQQITEQRLRDLLSKGISKNAKCKTQDNKSYTIDIVFSRTDMKLKGEFDNSKINKNTKFNSNK